MNDQVRLPAHLLKLVAAPVDDQAATPRVNRKVKQAKPSSIQSIKLMQQLQTVSSINTSSGAADRNDPANSLDSNGMCTIKIIVTDTDNDNDVQDCAVDKVYVKRWKHVSVMVVRGLKVVCRKIRRCARLLWQFSIYGCVKKTTGSQ